ncbi:E3 ubiquitin-protein ligase herc2 [Tritrichomonas musculus]|uniref:E3 ubiquitin-protein ligase herc2 n=1 Tax=Tritrichomonas musculus TaxID=1915356 RepID=A0ABR2K824_9EUKA
MAVYGLGLNNHYQSGPVSNDSVSFSDVMGSPTPYPIDANNLFLISCGMYHTLFLLKDGRVFVNGNDSNYRIGHPKHGEYKEPTEFIFKEPIIWITCGGNYSCYLTESGRLIYSNEETNGPYHVKYDLPIIYISGSAEVPVAIDEEGNVLIFEKNPKKPPQKYTLPSPVFEIAAGITLVFVITIDYKVYVKNIKDNSSFEVCADFEDIKIISIAGYLEHFLALSLDGEVYSKGRNSHCQCGNGSTDSVGHFIHVKGELENIKVKKIAVGGWNSLCLTEDSKLYGFGLNTSYQMSKLKNENGQLYRNVPYPTLINCFDDEVSDFALGSEFSYYLTGGISFPHPGRDKYFPNEQASKSQLVKKLYTFLQFPNDEEE